MAAWPGLGAGAVDQSAARLSSREVNWHLLLSAGGMPSSHAALVAGLSWAIGLEYGFDSPVFAIASVMAIIVIYDATGVRRAAGEHARVINRMIEDLTSGHPLKEEELKELLGHTRQVAAGTVFASSLALFWWFKQMQTQIQIQTKS